MTCAACPGQIQFYQLYVNSNKKITQEVIKRAEKGGCKSLWITVDAPQLGRREKDMRNKFTLESSNLQREKGMKEGNRSQGVARTLSSFIDAGLDWDELKWIQSITNIPIVLKGVQSGQDAIRAAQAGVAGIVVSNHGGRQLDSCRAGIEVLPEVMSALRSIGAENKVEVYVDGGVRRGTDIFKALALGAKAVGVGRPFLYGMAAYGQEGVERVIQLLKNELEVCMQLMGTRSINQIEPGMVAQRLGDTLIPVDVIQKLLQQKCNL